VKVAPFRPLKIKGDLTSMGHIPGIQERNLYTKDLEKTLNEMTLCVSHELLLWWPWCHQLTALLKVS
jgi:hypothetical protein